MRLNRAHFPWSVWVRSGQIEETDEFLRLSIFCGRRFFSNSLGNIHDQSEKLRLGRFAFLKWREQIDGNWEKCRFVVLTGNLAHGLEEAQLQRNRLLAHHGGCLHHFFRRLKFALGVDDLGAAFALRFGLLGHRALHRVGQRHVLHLDGRDFDAPRFGLPVDDLLQLQVDRLALRKQIIQGGLAEYAAQCRLRHQRGGFEKVLHFDDRGLRIDHAKINNRIDRHRDVVTRHYLLPLDADRHDAQIHSHHSIDDGNEENQTRPFSAKQFSEAKNHAAFILAQDADRLRQNDYGKNDEGYGPTNQFWQCFE